ncbi:MAG: efflux RND transporter permease subunit [Bacilli bacterium]
MKKVVKAIAGFLIKIRLLVLVLFLGLSVASGFMLQDVKINYDLSKYLGSETETSQALEIIQEEFGESGNLEVMIANINQDDAVDLKSQFEDLDYVLSVNFDEDDTNYYKDSNALYVILIDGNDYSENAQSVATEVKNVVTDYNEVYYGGTTTEKSRLKEEIETQIPFILSIALSLVFIILLLTATSWLEPVILLLCSGVAVIINLGTNAFFSEISYITNSVGAILQLALSIDYSIVLLNAYRKNLGLGMEKNEAMVKGISQVINPLSASSLTTIAGLVALLFMSFGIGFDIGIVLIKGILISFITSITFLPALIMCIDKALTKTKKKSIKLTGKGIFIFTKKYHKVVVPLTLVIIVAGGVINFTQSNYTYNDSNGADEEITETFGKNNTIVLVYPNSNKEKETAFLTDIQDYHDENDKLILKDYTALSNTSQEIYDIDKTASKLDISEHDAELLLALYKINNNPDSQLMTSREFIKQADYLINNDSDALDLSDAKTTNAINVMQAIDTLGSTNYTSAELYAALKAEPLDQLNSDITLRQLKSVYGTYYYSSVKNNELEFLTALDYLVDNLEATEIKDELTQSNKDDLVDLDDSLQDLTITLSQGEFQGYMYVTYGMYLPADQVQSIYYGYFNSVGTTQQTQAPLIPVLKYMVDASLITDAATVADIEDYYNTLEKCERMVTYQEFVPLLNEIIDDVSSDKHTNTLTAEKMQQIYILYYNDKGVFDDYKLTGSKLAAFILDEVKNDTFLASLMSQDNINNVEDLDQVINFFANSNSMNYVDMANTIATLQAKLHDEVISVTIDEYKVSGVYLKTALNNYAAYPDSVECSDLLYFLDENKTKNTLLKEKLTSSELEQIADGISDLDTANDLLIGEDYSRMILSVDLPNESTESTDYVNYLKDKVTEYFGEDAHIAGEVVSTVDLASTFETDQVLITLISVISILIIVSIIFKSLSLPLILVIIIQGAIFIAFATNPLFGTTFFMSYIIASSILMGATIDYGILMGSTYVGKRDKYNRSGALKEAIGVALPTVFTSGLILTVCGFVIAFISTQGSISTVGLLLGKGALASVLLVLFALPSFLYAFDQPILELTYQKKD